jgi:uncharacterized protein (DUF1501 family)
MPSRRILLKSGAMALVSLGFAPSFLARAAEAATRRKLLIALFQRGAVDGLNMVVPFGERDYYQVRPSIAIPEPGREGGALDLNGFFGFHPRMAPLEPLWHRGQLAIVHASGSHDATRSHFDAQDYMETATPGVKNTRAGWLNRYLGVADAASPAARSPLRGVALTRQMPRLLQGPSPALAMGSLSGFDVHGGLPARASFEEAYAAAADRVLNGTAGEAFDAMRVLERQRAAGRRGPARGVEYPRSPFGQALREIAGLAKADVGLEVAFAESTGWDHHLNEGGATGQMAVRLEDFSLAIAALVTDLGDRMDDTVILTMSEFGRAVAENGSRGTDHGHGNAMMLIGGRVRGGIVHGAWPGLAPEVRFEGRDLAVTTDFRDVFAEVVVRHLGASDADAREIFPGFGLDRSRFRNLIAM